MNITIKHDGTLTNAACIALGCKRGTTLAQARKLAPAGTVFVSATTGAKITRAKKATTVEHAAPTGFVRTKIALAAQAKREAQAAGFPSVHAQVMALGNAQAYTDLAYFANQS